MERKIGEIFEYQGEWYQCLPERHVCDYCAFKNDITCVTSKGIRGECQSASRQKDGVIFKKLEKVGEPFSCNYYGDGRLVMMQEYQLFDSNVIYCYQTPPMYITDYKHKRIAIEIKQNKEDMEEKNNAKHSNSEKIGKNFKEFDLEAAKSGKPVCTRDGRKARIIAFDRRLFYKNVSYPILALVERSDGEDDVCGYNEKGKVLIEDGAEYKDDLMMLPEKKEGWVNICRDAKDDDRIVLGSISESREEAVELAPNNDRYTTIATVRIEWEE